MSGAFRWIVSRRNHAGRTSNSRVRSMSVRDCWPCPTVHIAIYPRRFQAPRNGGTEQKMIDAQSGIRGRRHSGNNPRTYRCARPDGASAAHRSSPGQQPPVGPQSGKRPFPDAGTTVRQRRSKSFQLLRSTDHRCWGSQQAVIETPSAQETGSAPWVRFASTALSRPTLRRRITT